MKYNQARQQENILGTVIHITKNNSKGEDMAFLCNWQNKFKSYNPFLSQVNIYFVLMWGSRVLCHASRQNTTDLLILIMWNKNQCDKNHLFKIELIACCAKKQSSILLWMCRQNCRKVSHIASYCLKPFTIKCFHSLFALYVIIYNISVDVP